MALSEFSTRDSSRYYFSDHEGLVPLGNGGVSVLLDLLSSGSVTLFISRRQM